MAQNAQNKQQCQWLLDIVDDFYFTQLVHVPKCCTPTVANILGLVLITKPEFLSDISVILRISDHDHTSLKINKFVMSRLRPPRKAYDYKRGNIEGYKEEINELRKLFKLDFNSRTVEENWQNLKSAIISAAEKHVPQCTIRSSYRPLWFSQHLGRMIRKKTHSTRKQNVQI